MGLVARHVRRIATVHPGAGLALAARIGYWSGAWLAEKPLPTVEHLASVFAELDPRQARRLRRELASVDFRNRTFRFLIRTRGMGSLLPLLRVHAEPLERLLEEKTPVVVTGWHLGPPRHLVATLHKLGRKALMAVARPDLAPEKFERLEVWALHGSGLFAGFLRRAVDVLEAGGIVGMALDGGAGTRYPARFLGQGVEVGRGAASLARITGARLVPLTARWIGHSGSYETRLHPPLSEPRIDRRRAAAFEAELLDAAVRWFDDFARRNPESLRLPHFANPLQPARPMGVHPDLPLCGELTKRRGDEATPSSSSRTGS